MVILADNNMLKTKASPDRPLKDLHPFFTQVGEDNCETGGKQNDGRFAPMVRVYPQSKHMLNTTTRLAVGWQMEPRVFVLQLN